MDWIKKHTDQFALALLALVLCALSVLVILKTQSFSEGFSAAMTSPGHSKEIPKVDTSVIDAAQKKFVEPVTWSQKKEMGSLFVSERLLEEGGTLIKATSGDATSSDGKRKISKEWLLKYDLEILSSSVVDDDPDQDGFTNFDEFTGGKVDPSSGDMPPTDPKNKSSHPPYYTKLFLKEWIKIPFLLTFQSIDGDPKKPQEMTFQINAISRGSKTEFLKLGEKVANSPFRLEKYAEKKQMNKLGVEEDISELTITNTETNDPVILVLGRKTNSPDSHALFSYLWPEASKPQKIEVKKLQEFALKPEIQARYKLIDIKEDGAVIQLPGGDKTYNVPKLPKP